LELDFFHIVLAHDTLLSFWVDRLDVQQFEDISQELQTLHKSIKNIMEIVFAVSPLLALSTSGWDWKSIHRTYLLRVSDGFIFVIA